MWRGFIPKKAASASVYGYKWLIRQHNVLAVSEQTAQKLNATNGLCIILNPPKDVHSCDARKRQAGTWLCEISCDSTKSHTTKIVKFHSAEGQKEIK